MPTKGTVIAAIFLVAGTIIGGGMLALPVATGESGFFPSLIIMGACWLAMTLTALLYLEVTLWMETGVHVISMTSRILGSWGKWTAWFLYLFICYASLVAYTAAGGLPIAASIEALFGVSVSKEMGVLIFMLLFGTSFYFGNKYVGKINGILFTAMVGAYIVLVGMGIDEVHPSLLTRVSWSGIWFSIPLFLTSFSFQTMVPSLTPYLKRNAKSLRIAIVGGTTLSLLIYLIWQWLILGIVPVEGDNGLAEALRRGEPATQFIAHHVNGYHIGLIAEYFAFFAVVTSFLGIGLGLYDFLADGLKIKEKGWGNVILVLLIIIPTLYCATNFERVFFLALDATGGYGDSILNGIIPVLLVWVGRYKLGLGGKKSNILESRILLSFLFVFYLGVLLFKISVDAGWVS